MQKPCRKSPMSAVTAFLVFFLPQFLGNPVDSQETALGKNTKNANIGDFRHVFLHLTGPLVAKLFHILVEEVISFEMSGLTSKSVKN